VGAGARSVLPKRILVVDDEPGVRRLLGDLFASEGYLVNVASDGARGLERLRVFSPDVVILDLMMPIKSGWAFAEECRQIEEFRDLPIIAMSAMFDLPQAAPSLYALGVRACLAKPFDVDVLLSLVTELLAQGHAARAVTL
jgi:two-component system alkaline phosphatase synthesis response regulator PhoP